MIRKKIKEQLNTRLPAYVNGTLGPVQHQIIERWLERDEEAQATAENLKTLQTAVRRQPRPSPPPAVLQNIQAQIQVHQPAWKSRPTPQGASAQKPVLGVPVLLLSIVTLILAAMLIWQTLPPGIVLQWSVEGNTPQTFRVYRAELDAGETAAADQFKLLEEVPASSREQSYTFTDFRLLPGQNYIYRVDGLNATGQPAASQTITGQATEALPGQLALMYIFLFAGYFLWNMLQMSRPRKLTATPI